VAVDPVALVLIAPLEGLGFACTFVGGVTVLAARLPMSVSGTAQGLLSSSTGLATIFGSIVGGTVAGAVGISGMFAVSAAIGVVGTAVIAFAILGIGPAPATPSERSTTTTVLGGPEARG
jgi:MFS family permease